MKIAIITNPAYLEQALLLTKFISKYCNVHLYIVVRQLLEQVGCFEDDFTNWPTGVLDYDIPLSTTTDRSCIDILNSQHMVSVVVYETGRKIGSQFLKTTHDFQSALKNACYDLFHFEGVVPRAVGLFTFIKRSRMIVTEHDVVSRDGEWRFSRALLRSLYLLYASAIIARSQAMQDKLSCLVRARSHFIPLGPYNLGYGDNISTVKEPNTILLFGRLSPYKGIETLIDAALLAAQNISNLRVIVAGEPYNGYRLPDFPALPNGGLWDIRSRYISNDELAELFRKTALAVLPYRDATQSAVIMIAYAFNVPVLASAVGGIIEQVRDRETGFLVPPNNPAALAGAIQHGLDPEWQDNARQAIRNFIDFDNNWDSIARMTMKVYHTVMQTENGVLNEK